MTHFSEDFASGHLSLTVRRLAPKLSFGDPVFGAYFLWFIFLNTECCNDMYEPFPLAPASDTHVRYAGGHLACFCPSDSG